MVRHHSYGCNSEASKLMIGTNALLHGKEPGTMSDQSKSIADPHGLLSSFIQCPPSRQMTPNDVFIIWLLSHRDHTTAEAAQTILDVHGATMLQSGSDWLKALRELFLDIVSLSERSGLRHTTGD